jgi:phage-related protein (TIGR01555 family)
VSRQGKKLVKEFAKQLAMHFLEEKKPRRRASTRARKPADVKAAADRAARKRPAPIATDAVKAAADRAARPPIKISDTVLQLSKRRDERFPRVDPFKLPNFPVPLTDHIPADRRLAADEAINSVAAWAGGAWGSFGHNAAFEGVTFLGYPYLAELAQRAEYRVIVETIATEMTRKWIKIQAKGDKDKSRKISQLEEEFERLKVRDMFCKMAEIDGYFGRAHLYLDTGHTDDPQELRTPIGNGGNKISANKFERGSLKRLAAVEPVWTYPSSYNSNNPLKPDWYNPQSWFVMKDEVHVSRLLRFVAREVPDMLKPAYSFGGLSLTQMAKPYVDNWLNTRQSVADIVQAFSVMVLSTNLGESLTPGGDDLFKRADLFNNLRDNRGLMMIDKDSEEFANVSAQLGTLDALQAQAQEHMAAVSRIPLVKLLGISPHGLNATAEPEIRTFYDSIHALQEKFFSPNLTRVFHFAQLNIWGRVDPDLHYVYEPLWSLDEKAAAEVKKLEAETGQILIDDGAIAPEEERARVANDPDTLYQGLDINDVPEPPAEGEGEGGGEPPGNGEEPDSDEDGEDEE